jgi:hypothetical protein
MDDKKLNALIKKLSNESLRKVETKKIQKVDEPDICYADSVEETIRFHDEISKELEQNFFFG